MDNRNSYSKEAFLKELAHARRIELATMLMDGASIAELTAAGFSRNIVIAMSSQIKNNVAGMEDFSFEYPRKEETSAVRKERIAAANAANEKKNTDPQASAPDQTAGNESTEVETPGSDVPEQPETDVVENTTDQVEINSEAENTTPENVAPEVTAPETVESDNRPQA